MTVQRLDTLGWVLLGQLIGSPAYAADSEVPLLFGAAPFGALLLFGFALFAVAPKFMALLVAALWVAGLVLMISFYGVVDSWDRAAKLVWLLVRLTFPIAAGWLLGHVARKRFSGIGTRHG